MSGAVRVGLTGGVASGKSTVSAILADLGAVVIDADVLAREGGGAIFFVSNDRTGELRIRSSVLKTNPSDGFESSPGIFFLGDRQVVEDSIVR